MDLVFRLGAVVMFIGFVLLLFMEELPLRTMSGLQAQQADSAAAAAAVAAADGRAGAHEAEETAGDAAPL